jgi:uncharacterized OsmC-like protein
MRNSAFGKGSAETIEGTSKPKPLALLAGGLASCMALFRYCQIASVNEFGFDKVVKAI